MIDLTDENTRGMLEDRGFHCVGEFHAELDDDDPNRSMSYQKEIPMCPTDGIYEEWTLRITMYKRRMTAWLACDTRKNDDADGMLVYDSFAWLQGWLEFGIHDLMEQIDLLLEELSDNIGLCEIDYTQYCDRPDMVRSRRKFPISRQMKLF